MFSWNSAGSLIVEGTNNQYKYAFVLADHVHPLCIVFPQDDGIYLQDDTNCHTAGSVCGSKSTRMNLPFSPTANSPELNPIKDPHLYNLAQLTMALEPALLNIPVNTFRN
ncbi:transposable element Tcb1 transposase [Trichonephila clavipes]|nr:transposable element Tcb1 transposase [Trichonephila clavipes]